MTVNSKIDTGYIQILLFNTSLDTIISGTGPIIEIPFYISPSAMAGDSTLLHIEEIILSDIDVNKIPARTIDSWLYFEEIGTEEDTFIPLHKRYKLFEASPNPFTGVTQIRYEIPEPIKVKITIYNLSGQKIAILVNENKKVGCYTVGWNGKDKHGKKVASGIYFYRLEAGDYTATKKMYLLR